MYQFNTSLPIVKPTLRELKELRLIASLQFKGVGEEFIPSEVMVAKSRKTRKIRAVYLNDVPLAFLRAEDYKFALTIHGGLRLNDLLPMPYLRVIVGRDYCEAVEVSKGSIFASHVVFADPDIRPYDEVVALCEDLKVIAVGKALMPGWLMTYFRRGGTVRVRESIRDIVKLKTM
ncbi:MAG: hypothetical protein N3E36_02855 [Sulfolobales archaeon]|nr:hypothetical protein [Sulfolobales archaeon]